MSESHARPSVLPLVGAWSVIGLCAAILPLRNWDYWYYLTVGRLIATHGAVPNANVFGFSEDATLPIFEYAWLGDRLLFQLHELGSIVASLAVRNIATLLTWALVGWCVYRLSERNILGTLAALLVGGLTFLAVAGFAGPAMFVWPMFAALAALGVASLGWSRARAVGTFAVASLAASALWANTAPFFWLPAALALVLTGVAWRTARPTHRNWYLGTTVASLAVLAVATPHGVSIYQALLDTSGVAAWIAIGLVLALGRALAVVPRWEPRLARAPTVAFSVVLVLITLGAQPWSESHQSLPAAVWGDRVRQTDPLRGYGLADIPVEAVEIIRSWGSQPRVYAAPQLSGYILFHVQDPRRPERIVWHVPDAAPSAATLDRERAIESDPEVFRGVFHQLGIRAVIVTPELGPVGEFVAKAPDWTLVGSWPSGSLYVSER